MDPMPITNTVACAEKNQLGENVKESVNFNADRMNGANPVCDGNRIQWPVAISVGDDHNNRVGNAHTATIKRAKDGLVNRVECLSSVTARIGYILVKLQAVGDAPPIPKS
jgi:hypothetical protein